jgi:hypothetical protein
MFSLACDTKDITKFISANLDIPNVTNEEISSTKLNKKIIVSKYLEGCGMMGCSHFIFQELKTSCFSFLGTYHGTLAQSKKDINGLPSFDLSFKSGHKMKVFYSPKTKKYIEE